LQTGQQALYYYYYYYYLDLGEYIPEEGKNNEKIKVWNRH